MATPAARRGAGAAAGGGGGAKSPVTPSAATGAYQRGGGVGGGASSAAAAAAAAANTITLSDEVLRDLYGLYKAPEAVLKRSEFGRVGLLGIARATGLTPEPLPPRRRVTVLIVGNHSAGKSSFINYYVSGGAG